MGKIIITLLKPLSFLPALAMMFIIFNFSSQPGEQSAALSYQISYEIVETKSELLNEYKDPYLLDMEAQGIHYYVRKAAHVTEYFLLAVAISFPLYVYGLRGIFLILGAGFFSVGFAALDEYHQSMVAGRGPAAKDVLIDSTGAMLGILLVQAFCWASSHSPDRPKRRRSKGRNLQKEKIAKGALNREVIN